MTFFIITELVCCDWRMTKRNREMLTNVLKTLINNSFYESFNINFMRNEKSSQNINCFFFFFSHKNFL